MKRRLLAAGLVVLLAATAGCAGFLGSDDPDPEALTAEGEYDWEAPANTTFNISRSSFAAVISIDNRSHVVVHRTDELGTDEPLTLRALQFRYPNGTVVTANASGLWAEAEGSRTNISIPTRAGQVAFTAPRPKAKRFGSPVFVEGSHAVILPPNTRVGIPLLSRINPGGSNTTVRDDGRMVVVWQEVNRGPIITRYYLQRDVLLFGAIAAVLTVAGIGGAVYYVRQIRVLERKRHEIGLDVEMEDEEDEFDREDPPPGMG
jgi:hypothetical protein